MRLMKKHSQKPSTVTKPVKNAAKKPIGSSPQRALGTGAHKVTKRAPVTKHTGGVGPKSSSNARSAKQKPPAPKRKPESKPLAKAKSPTARVRSKARQTAPKTEAQYAAKPEKFKENWDRVLAVISKMRREKVSLTQASREVGIAPRTVTKWGSQALRRGINGKYSAKKQDSLLRVVLIRTAEGTRDIAVRGSKQVTLLAEYWNALHRYLQTGNAAQLKKFEGKHIKDANAVEVPLLTDLKILNRLGSAGVLSFESLYARSA
jgi:hypothetical protein